MTRNRPVCRDHHHIKFVDRPELTCLCLRSTCHTGKFVIHTEVVLKGDCSECLSCCLHLHILLRLDCLMKSVAPASAFHDTAGLLVDDLYLSVCDDIIDLPVEHCICLEELIHSMYTLRLESKVCKDLILLLLLFLNAQVRLLHLCDSRSHIWKHEEVRIGKVSGDEITALVGHVHRMLLLTDDEI